MNTREDGPRPARIEIDALERRLLIDGTPVRIGARAFDLLLALRQRRERVVGTHELLDVVWPGLVVEDNNLRVHVGALRKLLGPHAITTVPGRGYQLTLALHDDGGGPAPPMGDAGPPPAGPTLLGRDDELQQLGAQVRANALVSLIGAGGIGKTTLARALAQQLRGEFADGAGAVEFAPLKDAALLPAVVAAALGLPAQAGQSVDALVAQVATRHLLLVLDNCEHLADAVAALVARLHRGAPRLHLLVTSQVPLKLSFEHLQRLGALALPAPTASPDEARQAGAVALFVARAGAADPRFALTAHNVAGVVDICRRLDGIALAIELAAARVALLGVEGLRARLGERLRLLGGGARLALPRHQTLRAALDWSHGLLSTDEQAVFRRLGSFVGGFSLSAVQQLVVDVQIDEWAALDHLGALIDKSLVIVVANRGADDDREPRYDMLETLRDYACLQLQASGEGGTLARRHAEVFAALARAHSGTLGGAQAGAGREPLARNLDNLRASLDWAQLHDPVFGLRLCAWLVPFWRERGLGVEALGRLTRLLALAPADVEPEHRGIALVGVCALASENEDAALIQVHAEQALALGQATGDRLLTAAAHSWLGSAAWSRRDFGASVACYRAALAIQQALGDQPRVAEALSNVAAAHQEAGQLEAACEVLAQALPLARATGNRWVLGAVLENLCAVTYELGDAEAARGHGQESLALYREVQHRFRIAFGLQALGGIELRLGALTQALAHAREALSLCREHGFTSHRLPCVALMARIATFAGQGQRAARLFGIAELLRDGGSIRLACFDQVENDAAMTQARTLLDAKDWDAAWPAGRDMATDDAVALALQP